MSDFAFEALKPMVEADRQRRAETEGAGLEHESVHESRGATDEGSWLDGVRRGIQEGVEQSGLEHESRGATDDGNWLDGVRRGIQDGLEQSGLEHESSGATDDGNWIDGVGRGIESDGGVGNVDNVDGNQFDERSPAEMDRGFSLPDDGGRSPAELDPGFTLPEHIDFDESDVDMASDTGLGADDSGGDSDFFEG
jgi:hypothetical protein